MENAPGGIRAVGESGSGTGFAADASEASAAAADERLRRRVRGERGV